MLQSLKHVWSGFLVGAANIIPGVSGGTLLFILGLYDRSLGALGNLKGKSVFALVKHGCGAVFSRERKSHLTRFVEQARALDLPFIIRLLAGAGIAILFLSKLMKYLLANQFSNTYAFFFGLIAVSVILTFKMLKVRRWVHIVPFITGAAITIALTVAVDPASGARIKSKQYKAKYEASQTTEAQSADITGKARLSYTGQYSPAEFAQGALAGAVSVSAMILPGLSGSLVLILMGQYQDIISAMSGLTTWQLDYLAFLGVVGLGMAIGILTFARLLSFVLKRYHDGTVALMIGLTVGSLYALWPFKNAVTVPEGLYEKSDNGIITFTENAVVRSNMNILPDNAASAIFALVLCLAGVGVMILLDRYGAQADKKNYE